MTRLYARALRLLPSEVYDAHADEMLAVFEQIWHDMRRRHGLRRAVAIAVRELAELVRFAWCARRGALRPHRIDERLHAWSPQETLPMRETLIQDVRYAIRLLLRSPGVTLACVLTMALAIGATTAVFSVVYGVLLKPLPFPAAERLVVLGHHTDGAATLSSTTPGNLTDWQARATAFDGLAGFAYTQRVVIRGDYADRVLGALVVGDLFSILQRTARDGRTLRASDDDPGAPAVVVISDGFKQRVFGEQAAVGAPLLINGVPHTVAGVMPPDFAFPDYDAEYWVPARFDAQFRQNRDQYFLLGLARLRDETSLSGARAQLDTIMDAIRRDHPRATQNATAGLMPAHEFLVDGVQRRLWMLLIAVIFVLVIACANVANLQLARGASRTREMAVRHAIGARPHRLVRQILTESLVLAGVGGAAGLAVGVALSRALVAWIGDDLPRAAAVGMDTTVLLATTGLVVLCGVAFGIVPALQLTGRRGGDALQPGTRETGRARPVRTALVVAEVALAFAVLVAAGLLARSFGNLLDVRPGFEPSNLLTFNVSLPEAVYRSADDRYAYFARAMERLRALPGVRDVALSTTVPVAGRGTGAWFNIIDRPLPPDQTPPAVPYRVVSPNYFATVGIPLQRGRLLTADDGGTGPSAVVISESVARRFWPDGRALGQRIYLGAPDNRIVKEAEIVGVVGDVKQSSLAEATSEAVYLPHTSVRSMRSFAVVMRTATEPAALVGSARDALREVDPGVPMQGAQTIAEVVDRALAPARSSVYLLGTFAVMALALAVIGVFGVLSYTVALRRSEVAIRLAIGAEVRDVLGLLLRQGMRQVCGGLVLGALVSLPLGRYIETLLFGVRPVDPASWLLSATVLLVVAGIAVYIPARRIARINPVNALRV